MNKIFISYRRDDSADVAGRIYDRLVAKFGHDNVFKDVDSIPLGVDFRKYLQSVVEQCAVELVVIGNLWLDATDAEGQRRLDDPRDFVRIEIESALVRDISVIPLLVSGASMPSETKLPQSLVELTYRNGTPVRRDPDFHHDMDRLIVALEQHLASTRGKISSTQQTQLEYWMTLNNLLSAKKSFLRPQKPAPQGWVSFPVGKSNFRLDAALNTRDKVVTVSFVISDTDKQYYYEQLLNQRPAIEAEIGQTLEWRPLPENKSSDVRLSKRFDPLDRTTWISQHEWLWKTLESFHSAFSNRIKDIAPPR